jgi:hypothetical protein
MHARRRASGAHFADDADPCLCGYDIDFQRAKAEILADDLEATVPQVLGDKRLSCFT